MKNILIVHPSRGRPQQAKKIYDNITGNASKDNKITYIMALDLDDPKLKEYVDIFTMIATMSIGPSHTSAEATNRVYDKNLLALHDLVGIAADDIYFPENWDTELFKILDQYGYDKIIKTMNQFQGNPMLLNLQIGGTQFFIDYGTFYWPEYKTMMADDDVTEWAIRNKRYIDARHLLFPHMQYSLSMPKAITDKYGPVMSSDETYERENAGDAYEQGSRIFAKRIKEGFPPWRG